METKEIKWNELLKTALTEPGKILTAYRTFHGYSLGNQLLALMQCSMRGIQPGPIASFMKWKELGRSVKKGQKALALYMPFTCCKRRREEGEEEDGQTFTRFFLKNNWFVLSQTEGAEYQVPAIPEWNEERALAALKVERVPFDLPDGNTQGYAKPGRKIAINPIAALPHKTLFHELAHILLHCEAGALTDSEETPRNLAEVEAESIALLCCESLGLAGAEYCRGYIQSWAGFKDMPEKSAQKIFRAADMILRSGTGKGERE